MRPPKRPLRALIGLLAVAAVLGPGASQAGAVGELTFRECTADTAGVGCAALSPTVLTSARGVAVSPDGTSVYVLATGTDAIVHFVRNADGSLTFADCVSSSTLTGCTKIPTTIPGPMLNPVEAVVSPDGKSVYVVSAQSNSLIRFARAADGSLTYGNCLSDLGAFGCTNLPDVLTGAVDVAITPDGSSLYASGSLTATVSHFTIGADGVPAFANCVADDASDGCTDLPPILTNAFGMAISPSGGDLFVTAPQVNTFSHFTVGAGGNLTFSDCMNAGGVNGCSNAPTSSLSSPIAAAAGPGGNVYLAAVDSDTLSHFALDGNGKLTFAGCQANSSANGCVDVSAAPIDMPTSVEVSPDGDSVYLGGQASNDVLHFKANSAGRLTFDACQGSTGAQSCVDVPGNPLDATIDLAVAPEGDSLYSVALNSNSVSHFSRAVPPVVLPPADTTAPDTTIGSGPKRKSKKRKATFEFSSTEAGSTFTCALDKAAPSACTSPLTVRVKKKPKRHSLAVTAIDAAGNADASPATFSWKVKGKKR